MKPLPILFSALALASPAFAQGEQHLTLDGASDFVRVDNLSGLADVDAFTIEGWMRSNGGNHADKLIDLGQNPNYRWTIQATCDAPSTWNFHTEDGANDASLIFEGAPCDGEWHHFAMVDDGVTVSAFVDGALQLFAPSTGTLWQMDGKALSIGDHVVLGADSWTGDMDELRIWRRALDASEVATAAKWQLPSDATGLVSWWTFDEGAEDVIGTNAGSFGGDAHLEVSLDCNANQVPDSVDIALGTSIDCNANGMPDECELVPWQVADFESGVPANMELLDNAVWMDGAVRLNGDASGGADVGTLELLDSYQWQPQGDRTTRADFRIRLEGGYDVERFHIGTPNAHTMTADDWFRVELEFDHYFNANQGLEAEPNGNHLSLLVDTQIDGVVEHTILGHFVPSFELSGSGWLDVSVLVQGDRMSAWIGKVGEPMEQAFGAEPIPGTWDAMTNLSWEAWNGSGPGGNAHWVDDIAVSVDACHALIVSSVTPRGAWSYDRMLIQGVGFDGTETVTVGGTEYPLLNWRPDELEVGVPAIEPGLHDVVVTQNTQQGQAVSTMWPVLDVATTGIGGTADVRIDFSGPGIHLFAISNGAIAPIVFPGTWHGLELAQTPQLRIMATGFSNANGDVMWTYPIPSNPALAGAKIEVQAYSVEGLFQFTTSSFSNRVTVEL